jgi:hypothetical protein
MHNPRALKTQLLPVVGVGFIVLLWKLGSAAREFYETGGDATVIGAVTGL